MDTVNQTGIVTDIVYYNSDNGYTVFEFESDEAKDIITAVGYTVELKEGEHISVTGKWIVHPQYGEQLKVESYETLMPSEEEDILRYLSSGVVYGVRAATAKNLVNAFGKDTLNIMLTNPEKMACVKGISVKRAYKIHESFKEIQAMQSIVMFLQQYSISANMGMKVYKEFGPDAVDIIKKNPYVISDTIDGIKFSSADKIAHGEGFPHNSPLRIKSGVKYILLQAAYNSGHTYLPKSLLVEDVAYKLGVAEEEVENILSELIISNDIYIDKINNETVYFLTIHHKAEMYVSDRLSIMASSENELLSEREIEKRIESMEKIIGISYAQEQKNAVRAALGYKCMILTGGPGTGKTTTINTIIKLLDEFELKISLAAPTGRAAKRMTQLTGIEAKTIHRLLGATGEENGRKFTYNEDNPIGADVIILDEVSMIDINLMYSFLKAVKPGTRLIMSGDADQLPSVGPGNVLNDLIKSGAIPVIKLDKIFRQAEKSLIVVNAHNINKGILPELKDKENDFFFIPKNNTNDVLSTIVQLCKTRLPAAYNVNPYTDIQVLSPSKKGICGTINLNRVLQSQLNPPDILKNEYSYGKTVFRVGDKVMQIKNNYDLYYTRDIGESGVGIFNGEMGIIEEISVTDKFMTILFDEEKRVEYLFSQLDELDLAYAVTVHKSQGSEFPFLVMPVTQFPPMLMCRNLFYTAVTRAKNMVVLVGNEQAVEQMTYNNRENERFTGLCEKIVNANNDIFS